MISTDLRAALDARRRAFLAADVSALDELLHDDLTYVHSTGVCDTKSTLIAKLRSGELAYVTLDLDVVAAHTSSTMTTIVGTMAAQVEVTGQLVGVASRTLEAHVLLEGTWQLIAFQSTRRGSAG